MRGQFGLCQNRITGALEGSNTKRSVVREEWFFINLDAKGTPQEVGEKFGSEHNGGELLCIYERRYDIFIEDLISTLMTDQGECTAADVFIGIVRAAASRKVHSGTFIEATHAAQKSGTAFVDDLLEKMQRLDKISETDRFSFMLRSLFADTLKALKK